MGKTIYKTLGVRRSPIPRKSKAGSGGGFFSLLSKLDSASAKLNRARKR
ncbi:MAG TPA: hypothetical protein VK324_14750 [Tepidisphaeraceae bacterium]|nr:hypothetical protein [Tepidisphaeraceae bacterium]